MSEPSTNPFDPHPSDGDFLQKIVRPQLHAINQICANPNALSEIAALITGLQLAIWAHTQNRETPTPCK